EAVSFQLEETLEELQEKTKRKISTFFKRPKNVFIPLKVEIDETHTDIHELKNKSYIDYETIVNDLKTLASNLQQGSLKLTYLDDTKIPLEKIAEVVLETPSLSKASLDYLVKELDGVVIGPNEVF